MQIIVYPDQLRYRGPDQHKNVDFQIQPDGGTSEPRDGWQPRQLPQFQLPKGARNYYWFNTEKTTSAPAEAEGGSAWRRPVTWRPLDQILYGFGGFRAETSETAPDQAGLEGKIWGQPKPLPRSYCPKPWLYQQNTANDTSVGAESEGSNGWQPKPLRQPYFPANIWKYIIGLVQNTGELSFEGAAGGQFSVYWEYRTKYEDRILQFQRFIQNTGVSFSGGPFQDDNGQRWTPRFIRPFAMPRQAPYSYWFSGPNIANAPVEVETLLSFIPRAIPQFHLPPGIFLHLFTNTAQDFSVPVSTTVVGRVTGLENRPRHWPTIIR